MRTLAALPVDAVDFTPYGRVYDLGKDGGDVVVEPIPDVVDRFTGEPVVTGPAHVGLTIGPALPFTVTRMERHLHTREAVLCLDEAIVLMLSADPGTSPTAASTCAVLVCPGQCVSLRPGIWHSVGLGVRGPSRYYWLAGVSDLPESPWAEILDGPVQVAGPRGADELA